MSNPHHNSGFDRRLIQENGCSVLESKCQQCGFLIVRSAHDYAQQDAAETEHLLKHQAREKPPA